MIVMETSFLEQKTTATPSAHTQVILLEVETINSFF